MTLPDYKDFFRDKKITVMGLGLLGRGVGDVEFLSEQGADLIVTDLKNEAQLGESLLRLRKLPRFGEIKFVLGEHRLEDFRNRDFILKAAGVPLDSPYIAEARKNNIPIEMSASLFAKLSGATIVGVTGTRGKTTTTAMIYECLKQCGEGLNRSEGSVGPRATALGLARTTFLRKVVLGGNIRGVSTLALLSEVEEGDIVVLELDSWQLQGFGDSKISPHVAVWTTFMTDHMNYYGDSMEKYFEDKAQIFRHQTGEDYFIIGEQADPVIPANVLAKRIIARASDISRDWRLDVIGEHNRANAACARAALSALGIPEDRIRKNLEAFHAVEGRLQYVGTIRGRRVYNDNNATTPDATIAALKALRSYEGLVLIIGGADKGLSTFTLRHEISASGAKPVFLAGSGTDRFLKDNPFSEPPFVAKNLNEAIEEAFRLSLTGETILFSPGFASFGLFNNEYERNDQFLELISARKK